MKFFIPNIYFSLKRNLFYLLAYLLIIILFFVSFSKSFSAFFMLGISWRVLIPIISGYTIWTYRQKFFDTQLSSSPILGSIVLCVAFFFVFAGDASSTQCITELAFVIGIWGVVIFSGGLRFFRKLFWPLIYLIFISSATINTFSMFTPSLRYYSASGASYIANFTGYTVLQSGPFIRLPFMVLDVAKECSGVNHLLSLFIISIPLAIFTQKKFLPGVILVVSSFPIAFSANCIRIFILIAYNYNRKIFSHGPHDLFMTQAGFMIGLTTLYFLSLFFSYLSDKISPPKVNKTDIPRKVTFKYIEIKHLIILYVILFCGFILLNIWEVKNNLPTPDFSQLTQPIPGWKSSSVNTSSVFDSLPIPDAEYRIQLTNDLSSFYLYLGWYKKQSYGREIAGSLYDQHFKQFDRLHLKINSSDFISFRVCKSKQPDFSYWIIYRSLNKYSSNRFRIKLHTLSDAIFHRSTSGSIIILAIPNSIVDNFINSGNAEETIKNVFNLIDAAFTGSKQSSAL